MSSRSSSSLASTPSTSSSVVRVVSTPRPPVPVPSLPSEPSLETDLRLAGLRMSLPFLPTLLEDPAVAEVEDCEQPDARMDTHSPTSKGEQSQRPPTLSSVLKIFQTPKIYYYCIALTTSTTLQSSLIYSSHLKSQKSIIFKHGVLGFW